MTCYEGQLSVHWLLPMLGRWETWVDDFMVSCGAAWNRKMLSGCSAPSRDVLRSLRRLRSCLWSCDRATVMTTGGAAETSQSLLQMARVLGVLIPAMEMVTRLGDLVERPDILVEQLEVGSGAVAHWEIVCRKHERIASWVGTHGGVLGARLLEFDKRAVVVKDGDPAVLTELATELEQEVGLFVSHVGVSPDDNVEEMEQNTSGRTL